ncbi:MAG: tRNA (guanosine(46)-N7)-methyltransferase TrmB [Micromonosporaceae bacterium]
MRVGRADAMVSLFPRYGVPESVEPLDWSVLFGRRVPLVLEIGSGMGEATVAMAGADPGRDYLAVEVHTAGVANLLGLVEAAQLTNVRVAHADAVALLRNRVPTASVNTIHVFFPDPWPKARHHKRRLVQAERVRLLGDRLGPDGVLHCATDCVSYAYEMLEILDAAPEFANVHSGFAPRPSHRPDTRFEQRARAAGRGSYDLVFQRVARDRDSA